jgi:rare lipoprotein A
LVTLDLLMVGCASQTRIATYPAPASGPHPLAAGWSQVASDTGFLLASAPARPQLPVAPKGPHYVLGNPYQFDGTWYRPQADYGYEESGLASIYDQGSNGQVTADGEIYSDNAVTAAHKTLPLPSMVRVTNLDNGRSVEVRVNDRGPFVDNRVVQLSRHAGELLGINAGDAVRVHVQIMAAESQALAVSLGASGREEIPSLPAVPSPKLAVQPLSAELPTLRPETSETSPGPGASKVVIGPQYASADPAMPPSMLTEAGARYLIGEPYQFDGTWYRPAVDYSYDATGSAVVYDSSANGQATSNGEIYEDNALTAAHKTLPLPSLIQVTNLDNGRTVTVRVNDRGPFVDTELVQLSRGAGAALGINPGDTVRVRVQIKAAESRELASWFAAADRLRLNPPVLPGTNTAELPKPQHQVVIGPQFASLDGAYIADAQPVRSPDPDSAVANNRTVAPEIADLGVDLDQTKLTAAGKPVLLFSLQGQIRPSATPPPPAQPNNQARIYIQAGAFRQLANAERVRENLADLGDVSLVAETWGKNAVNCVRLGPLSSAADAQQLMDRLNDRGYRDSWLLVE